MLEFRGDRIKFSHDQMYLHVMNNVLPLYFDMRQLTSS